MIAVRRHQLPIRIGVERSGAGVQRVAIRPDDLEPAPAIDREIVGIAGLRQRALHMQLSHRRGSNAEAQLGAFGYRSLADPVRDALHPIDLIEQVGEFGARALVRRRIDICDVVRDDLDIELLSAHSGRRYCKSSHYPTSDCHSTDFLIRLHDLVAHGDGHLQRPLGRHDGFHHAAGPKPFP